MKDLLDQFKKHEEKDEKALTGIDRKLEIIKDNHLAHIQVSAATMQADIAWLKWGVMAILAAVLGLIVKNLTS